MLFRHKPTGEAAYFPSVLYRITPAPRTRPVGQIRLTVGFFVFVLPKYYSGFTFVRMII